MINSSRWYDTDGNSVYEVPNKTKGGMRRPTLADARKLGLLPSTTTILQVLAKPELDTWKQKQVLHAALTLPRNPDESDDDFMDRVMVDAFEQVDDAADLGKGIHAALESHFGRQRFDQKFAPYVIIVDNWVRDNGIKFLAHELRIVSKQGYAGTTDALIAVDGRDGTGILDFKSRKSKPDYTMKPWASEPMQIASYAKPKGATFGVNLFLSTTEPGRIEATWYEPEQLAAEYEAFLNAFRLWSHLNKYTPNVG